MIATCNAHPGHAGCGADGENYASLNIVCTDVEYCEGNGGYTVFCLHRSVSPTSSPTAAPHPPTPPTAHPSWAPQVPTFHPTSTYAPSSAPQPSVIWLLLTSPETYIPLIAGLSAIGMIAFIALSAVFVLKRWKRPSAAHATPHDALIINGEEIVGSVMTAKIATAAEQP